VGGGGTGMMGVGGFDFDFKILTAFIRLGRADPVGAGCPPYYLLLLFDFFDFLYFFSFIPTSHKLYYTSLIFVIFGLIINHHHIFQEVV
jgi:hypothetical protein